MSLILLPKAREDMREIWRYTFKTWSDIQASRYIASLNTSFDAIEAMPEIAREHLEFSPPVRIHPSGKHLIVYVIGQQKVEIARVLGARTDWRKALNS